MHQQRNQLAAIATAISLYAANLVKERRQNADFVVDDDGLGYYDDGEEHLFDPSGKGKRHKGLEGSKNTKAGALSFDAVKRARDLDAKRKGEQRRGKSE